MASRLAPQGPVPAYDTDGYGWANSQADLLRARRFGEADWLNIIEEIESVGRSEWRSLESNLAQILIHLLKWHFQPELRSRSWLVSIGTHRLNFEADLDKNPSLKPKVPDTLLSAYTYARKRAALETGLDIQTFPDICPYDWDEIMTRQLAL